MRTISFERWVLEVDAAATAEAYAALSKSQAEECGCTACRNWLAIRDSVLPPEIVSLLASLGIDRSKETELSEYEGGQVVKGRSLYCGEYLFFGRKQSGPECYVETPDGKGCKLELAPVSGSFHLGFSSRLRWARSDPSFPKERTAVLVFQAHTQRRVAHD